MKIAQLRVEHGANPLGIATAVPRFSWTLASSRRGDHQSSYRLIVGSEPAAVAAGTGDLWDSGWVDAQRSVLVEYEGTPLSSRQRCWWSVQVRDADGAPTPWAPAAWFETALLADDDWTADWVSAPADVRAPAQAPAAVDLGSWQGQRVARLRRRFVIDRPCTQARLYLTARGLVQLHINGVPVTDDVLVPGWTDYAKRQPYRTYDVSGLLRSGENVLAAVVAPGWYCGRVAWGERLYGTAPALGLQLELSLDDRRATIASDDQWRAARSEILWSDMLAGEVRDAREAVTGWMEPGFDDSTWAAADVTAHDGVPLVPAPGPPLRRLAEVNARAITQPAPGAWIYDLGQNIVGWTRVRVKAPAGTTVRLRFGEMLDEHGALYTENLRDAPSIDAFITAGHGEETFEPAFTYHGFRYIELSGVDTPVPLDAITGIVVGSAVATTGSFACSSELVNQLQRNIEWGQRGNFFDVPTDCPQRNERLGWTGDAQIFVPTAAWNGDVAAFFDKWMDDVLDARSPDGAFADVAPLVRPELFAKAAPGWGDAGVIVPWVLYERYGDMRLLARCFDAMCGWVDYIQAGNPDLLWRDGRGMDYGDWLAVDAVTPKEVLATAYFAHSAALTGRAAEVLGKDREAQRYDDLAASIRAAFVDAYVTPSGRVVGHTQTSYVLALAFDLLPRRLRKAAAEHLVDDIRRRGTHLSTGFLGVGHLMKALSDAGYLDVAYALLENDTFPSWGYSIRHGATTIWERWDGWTQEKGFQDPEMNSFNHYALGSVGDWLYGTVAGIRPVAPAFSRFLLWPRPGGTISAAKATFASPHGLIVSDWAQDDDAFRLRAVVPCNTVATVRLQSADPSAVTEGGVPLAKAQGVLETTVEGNDTLVSVGSGEYQFCVLRTGSARTGGTA